MALLSACGMTAGVTTTTSKTRAPLTTSTTSTSVPPSTPSLPSAPGAAVVTDLTWVSETQGWALVSDSGCTKVCHSEVFTTVDGGSSWSPVGSLPPAATCVGGCVPGQFQALHLRFANAHDGYAFDPDLFVTSDGGHTWQQEQGPNVVALEVAGANVIRVSSSHAGCPGPCDPVIEEASVGSSAWRELFAIPSQPIGAVQLVRQGPDDVDAAVFQNPAGGAPNEQTTLYISHDGGSTWRARTDPCGHSATTENDTLAVTAAPFDVVAVLCFPRTAEGSDFVDVSVDGGKTFRASASLPGEPVFQLMAATSQDDLFVATTRNGDGHAVLEASRDGGRHWSQVASDSRRASVSGYPWAGFLGFESSSVGRWVGSSSDIWTTLDGGATWILGSSPSGRAAPRSDKDV